MRYDTLVGDMGSALSGGQKQRVLLARALYPDPAVLFVDEGTAHLDPRSEAAVMSAIASLKITRILVTHRPVPASPGLRVLSSLAVRLPNSPLRPTRILLQTTAVEGRPRKAS